MNDKLEKWILITGAAKRVGAKMVEVLHSNGFNIVIHYNSSSEAASNLSAKLNQQRAGSSIIIGGNLTDDSAIETLIPNVIEQTGRLDVLINNASTFYPTPIENITLNDWDNLLGTNLKAPLFLSKHAAKYLKDSEGLIINIVDIHARKPLKNHPIYGSAKSGLAMLTKSLARDLAPSVRVNGIAPGMILWPENEPSESIKKSILDQIPLKRSGSPEDIASCALFLIKDAPYITGQIIPIDGGRSIGW